MRKIQGKKKKSPFLIVLMVVCLAVFVFCAVQIAKILLEDQAGNRAAEETVKKYVITREPDSAGGEDKEPAAYAVDFAALQADNPDVCGWLYSPGPVIEYPVLQGEDNDYYLDHTLTGEKHKYGSLFLDMNNAPDFTDPNTVIYGHRMNSGAMFGSLPQYEKQEYYEEHPTMQLYTPQGSYTLEIFSAFVAKTSEKYYQRTFASQEEFADFLEIFRDKSAIATDVEVGPGDRIVTLSTCTKNGGDDTRFVVMARLVAEA